MTETTRTPDSATRAEQRHRVLFVAEDVCAAPEVCAAIQLHAGGQPVDALVVVPAHDPERSWIIEGEAVAGAEERLRECVACLKTAGIDGEARVGDPDAVQAIADALYGFPADEIVIFTRPLKRSGWLHHRNVIDRARRKFPQPIEHTIVDAPK